MKLICAIKEIYPRSVKKHFNDSMNPYQAFVLWWSITNVIALPGIITYLSLDIKKLGIAIRLLLKVLPLVLFTVSILLGLAVGISQRTPYTGFITLFLFACVAGDAFLCLSDYELEHRFKKQAFTWKVLGVIAFAVAHIFLIIAFSLSPQLSAGFDSGSPAPWAFLILIPFAVIYLLLISFAVYMHKLAPGELVGVGLYVILLLTACWRAAARIGDNPFDQYLLPQIVSLAGTILFGVSDFCILIDAYFAPSKYAKLWILPLYWFSSSAVFLSSYLFKE